MPSASVKDPNVIFEKFVPAETYSEDTAGGVTVESPPPPPPTSGQT